MSYFDKNNIDHSNNQGNLNFFNEKNNNDEVVSTGAWVGILILTAIPFVNIIALLFMAFSADNNNIRNYGKASLILVAIPLSLLILFKGCSTP